MIIAENHSYTEKQVFKVSDLDAKCTVFSTGVYNFLNTKVYITNFLYLQLNSYIIYQRQR